jgi:protein O-GlcNAc transferase
LVTPIFKRSNGAKEAARRVAEVVKQACALLPGDVGRESTAQLAEAVARFLLDANLATHVGFALHLEGELRAAVAAYRRAVNLDATRFDAWYALGCAELDRDSYTEAIRCFHHALALRPTHARVHFDLGRALFCAGEVDAALDSLRIAANDPSELRREALARIARYIPGSPRADNAAVLESRRAWAALETVAEGSFRPFRHDAASSGRKLRIGYVSAFFWKGQLDEARLGRHQ